MHVACILWLCYVYYYLRYGLRTVLVVHYSLHLGMHAWVVEYGCSTSTSRNSSIMSKRAVLPTLYIHCCRLYVASVASYVTQQQHYGASIIPAVVTY